MVKGADRKKYYFRFYDPRVLQAFLPACTPQEARAFFGPIDRFYAEHRQPGRVLSFRMTPDGVRAALVTRDRA